MKIVLLCFRTLEESIISHKTTQLAYYKINQQQVTLTAAESNKLQN